MSSDFGFGGIDPQQYDRMRDTERRTLKRQSNRAGLCVVAFALLQNGIPYLFAASPALYGLYLHNNAFASIMEILFYLLSMFLPFVVAFLLLDKKEKQEVDHFCKPVSKAGAVLAVISGFFFCTLGNIITNYFVSLLESFGFTLTGGAYESPQNSVQLIFEVFSIGLLPALAEEFSLRGVIMQPMRRLGDWFAVVVSGFVFALMHGNLVQIPFAFIAGIAIGFYVIATDSIWVGVAIHALNNVYSVVLNYLLEVRPTAAETMYSLVTSVSIVGGIIAAACFAKVVQKRVRLPRPVTVLTAGEKATAYLFTVPMIIAVIMLIVETGQFISYTGSTY